MPAPGTGDDHLEIDKEWSNWVAHSSLLTGSLAEKPHRNNKPLEDDSLYAVEHCNALFGMEYQTSQEASQVNITRTHEPPEPQKDVGGTALVSPPQLPYSLQSSEQLVLHEMKRVVGDGPVSEFKLQFAPRWIIDKAIADEKSNYHDAGAYKELHFRQTPKGANVITSHHFFRIKNHAEEGRLRLKCRLVPHGNRDREKDSVRKDSATAQFPIIHLLLSLATILSLSVASIDIKGAYLQAGNLPRDIYISSTTKLGIIATNGMETPQAGLRHSGVWKIMATRFRGLALQK